MINLFIPYYIDQNPERQAEIDACLTLNCNNKFIDNIWLIYDDPNVFDNFEKRSRNCMAKYIQERPTYSAMFEIINEITDKDDWNVLVNSDIYLDETIKLIEKYDNDTFLALSRWDVDKQGKAILFNRWDSQDTWAFKGKAKKINADFYQGVAGCDNAIADRAHVAGYNVINPSKTIITYHLHNSGVRNYNPNNRVPKPYKLITPHQ